MVLKALDTLTYYLTSLLFLNHKLHTSYLCGLVIAFCPIICKDFFIVGLHHVDVRFVWKGSL